MDRLAEAAGLPTLPRLNAPAGDPRLAIPMLRRAVNQHRKRSGSLTLHLWSSKLRQAAGWSGLDQPTVMHLLDLPEAREIERLRNWTGDDRRIAVFSACLAEKLIEHGLPKDDIEVLKPAAPTGLISAMEKPSRQSKDVGADRTVGPRVIALADPPTAADCYLALAAVNLVSEARQDDVVLVTHPLASGRVRSTTLLAAMGHPGRLHQDPAVDCPWSILPTCDAVLLLEQPAPLSAAYAVASGLPIIVPDLPWQREALADAEPGQVRFAPSSHRKKLADRLYAALEEMHPDQAT